MSFQKILILIFAISGFQSFYGQEAPGYLGKKLIISYSGNISPTPFHPNKNGENGFSKFTYKHKISADYVRTRKTSIGMSFELYSTGLDNEFEIIGSNPNASSFSGLTSFQDRNYGILNVKGIGFYRLKFKKGIAPLGKYNILGVKLLVASTDLSTSNFTSSNGDDAVSFNVNNHEATYLKLGLILGSGINRVIKDKVVLKFGFNMTIIPLDIFNSFQSISLDDVNSDRSAPTSQRDLESLFKKQASKRLFGSEILTFTIGIGFLAY